MGLADAYPGPKGLTVHAGDQMSLGRILGFQSNHGRDSPRRTRSTQDRVGGRVHSCRNAALDNLNRASDQLGL
jgi:hypothetical protein